MSDFKFGTWYQIKDLKNDILVLAHDPYYGFMIGQSDGWHFVDEDGNTFSVDHEMNPTHWMPLPTPPEEK